MIADTIWSDFFRNGSGGEGYFAFTFQDTTGDTMFGVAWGLDDEGKPTQCAVFDTVDIAALHDAHRARPVHVKAYRSTDHYLPILRDAIVSSWRARLDMEAP